MGNGLQFRCKARDLAAWLGLVPATILYRRQTDAAGISKRGNLYVRKLLVHGARSCFRHLDRTRDRLGSRLDGLDARMHPNKAVVALANKMARIVWIVLTKPGATNAAILHSPDASASIAYRPHRREFYAARVLAQINTEDSNRLLLVPLHFPISASYSMVGESAGHLIRSHMHRSRSEPSFLNPPPEWFDGRLDLDPVSWFLSMRPFVCM
ncbi:transposase [Rhizobium grahamii]|uniref:transposase n=1 Tax=Rhizobium grahamii TaxID=1120045 RepID=UPI001FD16D69|nr:transposase [Rhizobium grahamii]